MHNQPILYSFRRCPWAMRARLALAHNHIQCALREVDLKHKPQAMIDISPKGTVPVLQLPDGSIIEESLDIISYAFDEKISAPIIKQCDTVFSKALHRYKYHERYPEQSQAEYRALCDSEFLDEIEKRLHEMPFVSGDSLGAIDIAIFPHIRQFSLVDADWFYTSRYTHITRWLREIYDSQSYDIIMTKYTPWREGDTVVPLLDT